MAGTWDHLCENPYEKAVPEDQLFKHDLITMHPLFFGRLQLLQLWQHTFPPWCTAPPSHEAPGAGQAEGSFWGSVGE